MSRRSALSNQDGFAMFISLLLLLVLGSLAGASLIQTTVDLKSTSHYRNGMRAFMAGEAGALHALSVMNTTLVWDIQHQLQTGSWTENSWMYGQTWESMPNVANTSYQVVVTPDDSDPDDRGMIIATGIGPEGSMDTIRLRIRRNGFTASPGAIYLVNDEVTSNFIGTAFGVDGTDHTIDGADPSTGIVKPGISTRNDTATDIVKESLNKGQKDNVQGLGFNPASDSGPAEPSVLPASGPNDAEVEEIINNILSNSTGIVENSDRIINGNCASPFGTLQSPQVTHLTRNSGVKINGDFCGAGVLIVEGPLDLSGSMSFVGFIIARSGVSLSGTGNSTIRGSIWTKGIEFSAGGSLLVEYSTPALELANRAGSNPDGNVPRVLTVASWEDL